MLTLNLPAYDCKITQKGGSLCIWDPIRRKYLSLTPEEWVRQHFVNYLVAYKGFPAMRIRLEGGHTHGEMSKRSDILVYDEHGNPFLLAECKAPYVPLTNDTFLQAANYNQKYRAPWLVLTNGLEHHWYRLTAEGYELVNRD